MNRAKRFILHSAEAVQRGTMAKHRVALSVTPSLRIECKFWLSEDGWNGSCERPSITVQAGSFERVKSEMEMALGAYMESLLSDAQPMKTELAA